MDQKEYHFYDMDEKQTEGKALLDHAHDHDHDHGLGGPTTAPSYFCAFLAGALAVLLLIVSLVLAWIVFSRHKGSSINLSHAIMCTLAFLFSLLCAFFAFTLWKQGHSGLAANANIAFIVYIGSLLFAIYFAVAALYLWVHHQFFSHTMKCSNSIPNDWKDNFWNKNYLDAHLLFWRLDLILAIFAIILAVCFGILASAAWHQLHNKVQAKKITLGIALIGIVIWGFLVVIWYQDYKATYAYIQSKIGHYAFIPFVVFIFGIIALGLAFLNAIFNFIKVKTINFIFAVIWIGFFLVFAIFVALLFRSAYNLSNQGSFGRQEVASFISQKHYGEFCGDKYLKAGQVCGGAYAANAWDRSPVTSAWLNPKCDCSTTDIMLWPWFCLAIFGGFLLGSVALAIVSNFGLATSENDEDTYNSFHIFDVIALGLILALGIALGFWLIFRPNGINNAYQLPKSGLYTDIRGNLLPTSNFVTVPSQISQNIQLKDQCYFLGKAVLPQFKPSTSKNIGYSVGVLVTNGRINNNYIGNDAKVGPKNSRQYFFPNSNNSNDDFINIYGKYDDVTDALRNLVICQSALQVNHGVYVHANQFDMNTVGSFGLTGGASPTYVEPYPGGSKADLSAYTHPAGVCEPSCTFEVVKPANGYLNIRGALYIKDASGKTVPYGVPEANLALNLYQNQNGREVYIALGSYDANGIFLIQAPFIQNAAYKAVLHIDDRSGQYQSNLVDILVAPPNANSDMNIGNIYLTTISGQGCKQADLGATTACFANQAAANAEMKVQLQDVVSPGADLKYPLTLTIRKTFSELGPVVATENVSSPNWSKSLPVGYYNVQVNGDAYNNFLQTVTLDSDQVINGFMEQRGNGGYRIYAAVDNTLDPNSDYDLNLKIRAADGTECVVSPTNQICPFATHIQSISQGQKGFEVIEVANFTNSYYMTYVTKKQIPVGNCPYANTPLIANPSKSLSSAVASNLVLNNQAVKIFTSDNNGGTNFGTIGSAGTASYTQQTPVVLNPINYGGSPVIPNLLGALAERNATIPADQLFKTYVRDADSAVLFGSSMPILYGQNNIQQQYNLIAQQTGLPSTIVGAFKQNFNNGSANQTDSQGLVTAYVYNLIRTVNANQNEVIRESNNLTPTSNFYAQDGFDNIVNFMAPYGAFDDNIKNQIQLISTNQYNYFGNNAQLNGLSTNQTTTISADGAAASTSTTDQSGAASTSTTADQSGAASTTTTDQSGAASTSTTDQSGDASSATTDQSGATSTSTTDQSGSTSSATTDQSGAATSSSTTSTTATNTTATEPADSEGGLTPEQEAAALAALEAQLQAQLAAQNQTNTSTTSDAAAAPADSGAQPASNDTSSTTTTTDSAPVVTITNDTSSSIAPTQNTSSTEPSNITVVVTELTTPSSTQPVVYNDTVYTKTVVLGDNGTYPLDTSLIYTNVSTTDGSQTTTTTTTTTQTVVVNPDGTTTVVDQSAAPAQSTSTTTDSNVVVTGDTAIAGSNPDAASTSTSSSSTSTTDSNVVVTGDTAIAGSNPDAASSTTSTTTSTTSSDVAPAASTNGTDSSATTDASSTDASSTQTSTATTDSTQSSGTTQASSTDSSATQTSSSTTSDQAAPADSTQQSSTTSTSTSTQPASQTTADSSSSTTSSSTADQSSATTTQTNSTSSDQAAPADSTQSSSTTTTTSTTTADQTAPADSTQTSSTTTSTTTTSDQAAPADSTQSSSTTTTTSTTTADQAAPADSTQSSSTTTTSTATSSDQAAPADSTQTLSTTSSTATTDQAAPADSTQSSSSTTTTSATTTSDQAAAGDSSQSSTSSSTTTATASDQVIAGNSTDSSSTSTTTTSDAAPADSTQSSTTTTTTTVEPAPADSTQSASTTTSTTEASPADSTQSSSTTTTSTSSTEAAPAAGSSSTTTTTTTSSTEAAPADSSSTTTQPAAASDSSSSTTTTTTTEAAPADSGSSTNSTSTTVVTSSEAAPADSSSTSTTTTTTSSDAAAPADSSTTTTTSSTTQPASSSDSSSATTTTTTTASSSEAAPADSSSTTTTSTTQPAASSDSGSSSTTTTTTTTTEAAPADSGSSSTTSTTQPAASSDSSSTTTTTTTSSEAAPAESSSTTTSSTSQPAATSDSSSSTTTTTTTSSTSEPAPAESSSSTTSSTTQPAASSDSSSTTTTTTTSSSQTAPASDSTQSTSTASSSSSPSDSAPGQAVSSSDQSSSTTSSTSSAPASSTDSSSSGSSTTTSGSQSSTTTTSNPDGSTTTTTTTVHPDGSQTTSSSTTTVSEQQVIPDRRLKTGRLLQAVEPTYVTQFCFTGFGEKSIKQFSSTGTGVPSIQPCVDMYPDNDSYSLAKLKQAMN
jgi:hypothetical protein